jgi:hypothetical protein
MCVAAEKPGMFLVTVKVTSQNSDEDFSRKTKVLEDIQMKLKIQ